jgi:hypothetical protein
VAAAACAEITAIITTAFNLIPLASAPHKISATLGSRAGHYCAVILTNSELKSTGKQETGFFVSANRRYDRVEGPLGRPIERMLFCAAG